MSVVAAATGFARVTVTWSSPASVGLSHPQRHWVMTQWGVLAKGWASGASAAGRGPRGPRVGTRLTDDTFDGA